MLSSSMISPIYLFWSIEFLPKSTLASVVPVISSKVAMVPTRLTRM